MSVLALHTLHLPFFILLTNTCYSIPQREEKCKPRLSPQKDGNPRLHMLETHKRRADTHNPALFLSQSESFSPHKNADTCVSAFSKGLITTQQGASKNWKFQLLDAPCSSNLFS
jgi:hypothetical protein